MTSSRFRAIGMLVPLALCAGAVSSDVPVGMFTLDHVTVGVTTIEDVHKSYGLAAASKVSREDESDVHICYVCSSAKGATFVVFETGAMGGFTRVTGFRISSRRPEDVGCVPTNRDPGLLETANGVRLGQTTEEFKGAVPVLFGRLNGTLTYEAVTQRALTPEEVRRLRVRWPGARDDYFDVTTTLTAKFEDDRLSELYVRRIESY